MSAKVSPQATDVFISYAREDDDFVRGLVAGLKDLGVEAKGAWPAVESYRLDDLVKNEPGRNIHS